MLTKRNFAGLLLAALPLICVTTAFGADGAQQHSRNDGPGDPLFLTATNATPNFLAIVNTRTKQMDFVPTGGNGGASGNAGGVAVEGNVAAVVNFASSSVTVFIRRGNAMQPTQTITTTSQPVSVAFGHNHLVVLGLTTAESFPVYGSTVGPNDGIVQLMRADKTAAQIVTFDGGAVYSEKSGNISELRLSANGSAGISGPNLPVTLPPAPNNDTPFGMAARGGNVYVTIAHSDLQALVVNGGIISTVAGPVPFVGQPGTFLHAPCWNALSGHFLFSSDSPGKQLLRYLVSDSNIFFDKARIATFAGAPTDLYVRDNLLGVIDGGDGTNSNVSLFEIDSEGKLTLRFAVKIAGAINGAAIIQ